MSERLRSVDVRALGEDPEAAALPADGSAPLPPLPDAKEVSELLPEGMGLDVLRQGGVVPLRIDSGVLIVGASSLDAWPRAQVLGTALERPVEIELRTESR